MPVRLHRDIRGTADGTPVVLASSLGATAAMWAPQVDVLAQQHRVIAYDHRGHGRSEAPPGPYSIADLGEDVLAMLDQLEIGRAHFCGLSLGGMVGLWLGAHAPERVMSLTLCCTSAYPGNDSMWEQRAQTVEQAHSAAPVADAIVARWTTPAYAVDHPDVVAALRDGLATQPPDGYAACCRALAGLDLRPFLASISAPTLVVSGAQDEALPPAHQQLIADEIPHARLETIDPGAHLPNVEQPDVFNALVAEHVAHA